MATASTEPAGRGSPRRIALSPTAAIVLAISSGLCAGYLDLTIIAARKFWWNPEGFYRTATDFPWSVPVGHAALMAIPGIVVAAASRLRPGLVSLARARGCW